MTFKRIILTLTLATAILLATTLSMAAYRKADKMDAETLLAEGNYSREDQKPDKIEAEAFLTEGNYSRDELLLFSDLAFLEGRLSKWEEDIRVEIKDPGHLRPAQIADVDSIIRIFSGLIAPLKIYRVESGGNLLVYRDIENPDFGGLGLCRSPYFKDRRISVIRQAKVYDVLGVVGGMVCIHEMLHAIGLQHPSRSYPFYTSMLTRKTPYYFTTWDEYEKIRSIPNYISEQEKKVVRMMYSPHIKPGLTKTEFLKKMKLSEGDVLTAYKNETGASKNFQE